MGIRLPSFAARSCDAIPAASTMFSTGSAPASVTRCETTLSLDLKPVTFARTIVPPSFTKLAAITSTTRPGFATWPLSGSRKPHL
jgi:hypothetical protein